FEYQFWIYRANSDASAVALLENSETIATGSGKLNTSVYIQEGNIMVHPGGTWVDTNADIAVGVWTRVRMSFDMSSGDYGAYTLYIMPEGQAETEVWTGDLTTSARTVLNAIRFNPQGTTGGQTYIDDISLTIVPEPTAMMLLGLGSIGVLIGRKRHV
ncbi:MAG TPA: PEP-CTERM sorting domain-containing protein, partial [Phycisphaerae bacterium]|nr:PEP-CTERM sorting domain-containing protein [Phycisphaerae bacterium]